ncbi:ribosome small subunit-dependent GTPase A [Shimia sp.]|uniref:ribosome small subunit-dependent GTPase A n=1 Tax=Shimia sp. TaxID=1954381 RepID=UPI0032991EC2
MTRDYSQFLPLGGQTPPPEAQASLLSRLGWQPFFSRQTDPGTLGATPPARVTEVHRTGLRVRGDGFDDVIPAGPDATVGDWFLFDHETPAQSVLLERKSLFKRRAAGHDRRVQLIAANIDTAFVVSSCNADFNIARMERYIALAFEADVTPVILLTKADLCDDPDSYVQQAMSISDRVVVLALNALSTEPVAKLADWCKPGQTVAFLGSSGVGKSTLVNALFAEERAETADIREDDAKGRHTTTSRQMHFTRDGVAVLDTPGMRELQLTDVEDGIADLFSDVTELAATCKFNDCAHETEPGCAVSAAVKAGELDPARLARWRKLAAEDRFNSASLSERRSKDKTFGKMVRTIVKNRKKR